MSRRSTGRRDALVLALVMAALGWGVFKSVAVAPALRPEPRRIHWVERYGALREPLAVRGRALYVAAPGVKHRLGLFRARYVLAPITLDYRRGLDLSKLRRGQDDALVLDFGSAKEVAPAIADLRRWSAEHGAAIEIRDFGKGLVLVRVDG